MVSTVSSIFYYLNNNSRSLFPTFLTDFVTVCHLWCRLEILKHEKQIYKMILKSTYKTSIHCTAYVLKQKHNKVKSYSICK